MKAMKHLFGEKMREYSSVINYQREAVESVSSFKYAAAVIQPQ